MRHEPVEKEKAADEEPAGRLADELGTERRHELGRRAVSRARRFCTSAQASHLNNRRSNTAKTRHALCSDARSKLGMCYAEADPDGESCFFVTNSTEVPLRL